MTTFIRVIESSVDEKPAALLGAVDALRRGGRLDPANGLFERAPQTFSVVPGSPFSYWLSDALAALFKVGQRLEDEPYAVRAGLATGNDGRYLRAWFEVADSAHSAQQWRSFAKGGAFGSFYADLPLVIDWTRDGEPIELAFIGARVRKPDFGRPGLTWPIKNRHSFKPRCLPAESIFGHVGPSLFVDRNDSTRLLATQALLSSAAFSALVKPMAGWNFEAGVVGKAPLPHLGPRDLEELRHLARRGWSLKRSLDTVNETSHAFVLPRGLNEAVTGLDRAAAERDLEATQRDVDGAAMSLYRIRQEERAAIEAASTAPRGKEELSEAVADDSEFGEGDSEPLDTAPGGEFGESGPLISWMVGVAFCRFDPRLATGERAIPPEPEPFDSLPARSPGMYPEDEDPADRPDILVDDEGHADDLAARVIAVAERVRVDVSDDLRAWLAKEFFPLHIKMYSKSRRKAPIYWQLATASARYSVWLYIHAFTKDTLFRVQNDYVAPKLAHEERRLESLTREAREEATAGKRKELTAQEAFVEELRAFLDEVKRVAPLWNPNLDDGVVINFAPLWRLVPQNKPWQKELKSTWDALCERKYDWAHLAMHLWPEHVVPKCSEDRSLAIAHGLEDVFWVEGPDGKWTARKTPTTSVDVLVKERTSPAVKAALTSLLEAPVASGGGNRRTPAGRRGAAASRKGKDA